MMLRNFKTFKEGILRIFTILCIVLITISCVGTIEDENPISTKGAGTSKEPTYFDGVYKVVPISDEKAEVYFFPANELASEITYVVSYDGLKVPHTFAGELLSPDYRGLLSVTISGLQPNTTYSFTVQTEKTDGTVSYSDKVESATTFSNVTADFVGISNVANLAGVSGKNSLMVSWTAAYREGSVIFPREPDPVNYEITLLNANEATPSAFDDESLSDTARKVVLAQGTKISHTVNGLTPNTKYYIRVRAIHQGYIDNAGDVTYKKEENNKYIEFATLGGAESLNFEADSLGINPLPGAAGKNGFFINWGVVAGAFDHYRLYYKKTSDLSDWNTYIGTRNTTCNGLEGGVWNCQRIDYEASSFTLTDLDSFTEYDMYLVICPEASCATDVSLFTTTNPYKTVPEIIKYSGIQAIDPPRYFYSLNEMYIKIPSIDISQGYLDGLLVELKQRPEGPSRLNDVILNHPNGTVTDITVKPFDYLVDREIVVTGLDPETIYDYCFSVFPYYIDNGTLVEVRENATQMCQFLTAFPPTVGEFNGPIAANATNSIVSLSWQAPTKGIYDKYRAIIRTDGAPFSLSAAIDHIRNNPGQTLYVMQEVDYLALGTIFTGVPSGTYYMGVWTYFTDSDSYSSNTNLLTVTVP